MLLIVGYMAVATLVVALSVKASEYIDMLDSRTRLSGAFLGGVLLSAVTSLPELFTSVSATLLLDEPSLCIGNILGSDLFNLAAFAAVGFLFVRHFSRAKLASSNALVALFVVAIYVAMILNWFNILNFELATVNILTIVIIVLYCVGVRYLAVGDSKPSDVDDAASEGSQSADDDGLSVRTIVVRFVLVAIGIVTMSVVMTYLTDALAAEYNIGKGLAGALFLGVATSLPELSSTVALFRMRNYDVATGNIVGSNLFNFMILCVVDVVSVGSRVYDYSDPKIENLLVYGLLSAIVMLPLIRTQNRFVRWACMAVVVGCYFAFLLVE